MFPRVKVKINLQRSLFSFDYWITFTFSFWGIFTFGDDKRTKFHGETSTFSMLASKESCLTRSLYLCLCDVVLSKNFKIN
jgi:hypothetical protein